MNDEIEKYMNRVLKDIEAWEDDKSVQNAKALNLDLSVLKLLVSNQKFDELDAFSRYLNETTKFLMPKGEKK